MRNFLVLSLAILYTFFTLASAQVTTIYTNTQYIGGNHNINSVDGVLFVPENNQTITQIVRSPLDNAPYCVIIDATTNLGIFNSTWQSNACYVINVVLLQGRTYRIGTGADSAQYTNGYDQGFLPANYPGIGNFIGGCYGPNCSIHTISSTMYSIESITVDAYVPQPPSLEYIGPQIINENQTLTIQLQATDPNLNDTLTFLSNAQTTLPSNPFLNSQTGEFTWTPGFSNQGFYQATFYVTDGQFVDYEIVNIQVLDTNFATISTQSNASIGNNLVLNLNDIQNPNRPYILSSSFGSFPGIPLGDGRIIPLNNDWLFNAVIYTPSLFGFTNSIGTLDSQGNAQVTWSIPNNPIFQGANIKFSFVTLDYNSVGLNFFRSIAPAVNVTIQ